MRMKELQAKRQALLDDAQKIIDAAGDQMVSDENAAAVKAAMDEADTVGNEIDALAKKSAEQAEMKAKLHAAKDRPDNPQIRSLIENHGSLASSSLFVSERQEFKLPKTVRAHRVQNFTPGEDGTTPEMKAFRFGCWAMSLLGNCMPQFKGVTAQAEKYARDMGIFNAAHGEGGSDSTGAHVFVPTEFGMDLILLREQFGTARRLLNVVPMSSDKKTEPRQLSGLTAYFVGENTAGTESTMSHDNVTLVAKDLMTLARISRQLDMDSVISWADKLVREIAYSFASKEDDCAFNGDGTSTYGGITGIRAKLDTLTAGTAPGLILGAGNAYSELTLANFESMLGALPQYAETPATRFVAHKTFYYTVMVKLINAAGGLTGTEIVNGRRMPMFMGYPVEFCQKYPSTAANSQIPVTFGDHSLGAMFGDRARDEIAFSDQATIGGESMFERNQIGVRGTERFDVVVHDFGSNTVAGPIVGLEMAAS